MVWKFIDTGFGTGRFNMDFDLELAKNCSPSEAIFRVYRWHPSCISLGANQKIEDINIDKTASDNIDVIKRPTGGRAILHSEELTYSVIYPIDYNTSAHNLYNQINYALKRGLNIYDGRLSPIKLENKQPDFKNFYQQDKSSVCFAVSAKSEINFDNKKLVGSAQRKLGKVILQHGSILCGDYHLKITDYLNLDDERKSYVKNELMNSTIDLRCILKKEIDFLKLTESLKKGFEKHFKIEFQSLQKSIIL